MTQTHHHIGSVILAHLTAIGINLTGVNDWLKCISLLAAIGYTIWKWYTDYKKDKKDE